MNTTPHRLFFIALTGLVFIHVAVRAQLVTNISAAITISSGAQVTVKGDFVNAAGATISNSGTVDLSGDWINNSGNDVFGLSSGTVILNGASQAIAGSNTTVFNNLTLLGGGIKSLQINTITGGGNGTPAGILDIGTSVIDLQSKNLFISNPSPAAITFSTGIIVSEDADNSSTVQWNIRTTTGNHIIPFGTTGGIQLPLHINLAAGDIGTVTASTYPTAPDNTPLPVTPTMVTHVRDLAGNDNSANTVDRFWQIDKTGLTGTASIRFTFAPSESPANGNLNIVAQRWDAPNLAWQAPLPGQSNPSTNSVLVNNVTASGPWALALLSSPLPITLLNFDARLNKKNKVDLWWTTSSEINNDYFTVEKSRDGMNFEAIAIVDGAGNSTTYLDYAATDDHPYPGINYYRLRQTDFDGHFSFSEIKAVTLDGKTGFDIVLFPNPAQSVLNIMAQEGPYSFVILDATGRRVMEATDQRRVNIQRLSPGVYTLVLYAGENISRKQFTKSE